MDKRLAPVAFSAPAQFAAAATDGTRRFAAIAYGGGVVTDHPLFDRVAFDLSSTKFGMPAPMLREHEHEVGVIETVGMTGKVTIDGKLFSDVDERAKNIADKADRGMPWQVSVRIKPGKIDQFKAGSKVTLNGQVFDGPLTVFRNNRIRECSFCALGADDTTSAEIFTIGGDGPRSLGAPGMEFTHTQADIDAAVAAAVAIEKANTAAEKTRADALQAQFSAQRSATRTATLKDLFTASGREFKDELAKPYLDMTDEQFAASTDLFKGQKPAIDPALFKEQAKGAGGEEVNLESTTSIVAAAERFMVDQAKLGKDISVADAVSHVKFTAKKAA